ncbi:putative aspartate aminotransferase, cytoplasmic [Armadillidium vulgare]|nr:putative aspartate aminotransferase, cytoplasmic [Armadillidium vulgare]
MKLESYCIRIIPNYIDSILNLFLHSKSFRSGERYCLNLELSSTLLCKNMGLVGVRLTIFTLINFVAKSKLDRRELNGGEL